MRRTVIMAMSGILLAAAAVAVGYTPDAGSPHAFTDSDCFLCHFTLPREGKTDTKNMRFMDTITNLCSRCHDMSGEVSHRVDIVPSTNIAVPADMPLDASGRMTCVTCHDVHKPYKNPLTGKRTYFLRREPPGKTFCLACHGSPGAITEISLSGTAPGKGTTHRPTMDKAHGFAKFKVLDATTDLDPLSLACLDCHNDPGSPYRTTLGAGIWRHAKEGIGESHPIGLDYYRATLDHDDLVPENDMDKRVRLFDGRIGCCTCHDPYSPAGGDFLVIGTRDSYQDLCFACHLK